MEISTRLNDIQVSAILGIANSIYWYAVPQSQVGLIIGIYWAFGSTYVRDNIFQPLVDMAFHRFISRLVLNLKDVHWRSIRESLETTAGYVDTTDMIGSTLPNSREYELGPMRSDGVK